ncbi:MAG TPA: hypothetical protein VE934_17575, partial [Polaromonas sp.]|nr:hypothetical protein [Polaromonas sp.]
GDFYQQAIKAKAIDQRARFTATQGLSNMGPPLALVPPPLVVEPMPEAEMQAGNPASTTSPAALPAASGVLSPPPIKYVTIQLPAGGVTPAAREPREPRETREPQLIVLPPAPAPVEPTPVLRIERTERAEPAVPPSFPLSELPAPAAVPAR